MSVQPNGDRILIRGSLRHGADKIVQREHEGGSMNSYRIAARARSARSHVELSSARIGESACIWTI